MKISPLTYGVSLATMMPLLAAACGAPDDRADEDVPPARSVLEVVLDDSIAFPVDSVANVSAEGAMCLRGDPDRGEPWSVDALGDTLNVISLERLTALAPRDSARLAARLARTADALPGDTSVADFRGLPVVIRDAWLLVPDDGDTTFIAIASRRVPMESSPLEEQLTLLATPDSIPGRGRALVARWFARAAGMEDSIETRDPVLAFRGPERTVHLLLLREAGDVPRIESLVRTDAGWHRRWIGSLPGCG